MRMRIRTAGLVCSEGGALCGSCVLDESVPERKIPGFISILRFKKRDVKPGVEETKAQGGEESVLVESHLNSVLFTARVLLLSPYHLASLERRGEGRGEMATRRGSWRAAELTTASLGSPPPLGPC